MEFPKRAAEERIPQTLDDEGGGVRGRSDLGAERTGCGGAVFRELGRTQETHPADRTGIENGKLNRAAFAPTANPGGETKRVGLRGMLDLSGLSARNIHFKSWIRDKFKIPRIVMRPSGNAVRFFDSGFFIPKLFFFDKVPASLMLESQESASGAFRVPTNAPVVSELAREFEKKFTSARAIGPPLGIPVEFSPRLKIRRQILANPAQGIGKFPGGIPIFRTWEWFMLHDIQRPEGPFSSALLARPAPSAISARPRPAGQPAVALSHICPNARLWLNICRRPASSHSARTD